MIVIFIFILVISLILAWRSMKDFHLPLELKKLISSQKLRGTIVFLRNKVIHYK